MKNTDSFVLFWLILLGLFIAFFTGFYLGETRMQKEAVVKGHAEWVADANGKAVFKWKECK
jgi:hypothetical protein